MYLTFFTLVYNSLPSDGKSSLGRQAALGVLARCAVVYQRRLGGFNLA